MAMFIPATPRWTGRQTGGECLTFNHLAADISLPARKTDGRFPDDPTIESCGSCAEMFATEHQMKDPRRNSNVTGHPVEPASPSRCNEARAAQQPPRRARSNCDHPRLGGDRACTLTVPVQWDLTVSPWRRAAAPRQTTSAPCAKVRRITLRWSAKRPDVVS